MQHDRTHNGQRKTRKDFRNEKANKSGKGLVTPEAKFFTVRILVALVVEGIKALFENRA